MLRDDVSKDCKHTFEIVCQINEKSTVKTSPSFKLFVIYNYTDGSTNIQAYIHPFYSNNNALYLSLIQPLGKCLKLHTILKSHDYNFGNKINNKINNTNLVSNVKVIVNDTFTADIRSRLIDVVHSSTIHRYKRNQV